MIEHQLYITNVRPMQQSSPSDQSMSSATPPHQVSRASPASTALVMSNTNIHAKSNSRQLTPNSSQNSSNGTSSSTNSSNAGSGLPQGQQHPSQQQANSQHQPSNMHAPPNPMMRQFTCHTKSMSAGVVVSVPGISNNLATAVGMNHNPVVGSNHSGNTNQHHSTRIPGHPQPGPRNYQQQVIKEHRTSGHHHRQQQMSQVPNTHSQHHLHSYPNQLSNADLHGNGNNNNNLINPRGNPATSSSIVLSNNNINSVHHRSASTHLSNVMLGPQDNSSSHHNNNSNHPSSRNFPPHVAGSIWSIDENIHKSHGKLTSSGYIPCLYPSVTDMSCDNISNAGRMVDGGPAPSYYLQTRNNLPPTSTIPPCSSPKTPEFLPICDLMFNLISIIICFCENTFGIIALIALYYHASSQSWALIGLVFVLSSNIICQYLSFKWLFKSRLEECKRKREAQDELEYEENCDRRCYNRIPVNMRNYQCGSCTWLPDSATEVQLRFFMSVALDALVHALCLGMLVRYVKLVIPVEDTARVKREARDLCMLRMIHGFIQSAPLLLLQSYMICSQTSFGTITHLSVTSAVLSLINVCWALASFTKYTRRKFMHKFVLTWLGIISQLLWRLCTVSSRVAALTIYAVYYNYWMLVVLALHWVTMFLWLIKPGNLLRDEVNMSRGRKLTMAVAVAWIYCFCYVNLEEHNSNQKMTCYYLIMFLENNLLLTVCLIFSSQVTWFKNISILVVYLGFVFGLLFIVLYYKYFHTNILNDGLSCSQDSIDSIADQLSPAGKKITGFKPGTLRLKSEDGMSVGVRYNGTMSAPFLSASHSEITRTIRPPYLSSNQIASQQQGGIFNCKLNTATRKQNPNQQTRRREP